MNAFDALAGWKLKAVCAAIMVGGLALGVGTLWLTYKATEKDRDAAIAWGVNTCTAIGTPWRDDPTKPGKFIKKADWGRDCDARIRWLAAFYANAVTAAANTVLTHDTEQTAKAATDRPAARRSASRIQSGQQQMETAIDHSQDGHLGPDYFDGLNRALGLRPYVGTAAPGPAGGDHAEGQAVSGPAGMQ